MSHNCNRFIWGSLWLLSPQPSIFFSRKPTAFCRWFLLPDLSVNSYFLLLRMGEFLTLKMEWFDLYVLKLFFTVERALAKWVDRRSSNSSGPCSVLGKWWRGDRGSLASLFGWHADGCHRSPTLHHSSTWSMVPRPVRHLGTLTPTLAHLHFRLHCDWYSCYIRHG